MGLKCGCDWFWFSSKEKGGCCWRKDVFSCGWGKVGDLVVGKVTRSAVVCCFFRILRKSCTCFCMFLLFFAVFCCFLHFFAEKINDFSCQISTIQKKGKKRLWFQEMDDWGLIHSQGVGWAWGGAGGGEGVGYGYVCLWKFVIIVWSYQIMSWVDGGGCGKLYGVVVEDGYVGMGGKGMVGGRLGDIKH